MKSIVWLTTALVTLPATVLAQQFDAARVDSVVNAELQRQRVPGVAIAIVKRGQTLLAKGYGQANVEHRVPVTRETIFQSGSVGKQFTSALIMLLVEDGKIRLEDPITRFLPAAPATWQQVTIRNLLTHTSGIPDYTNETFDFRRDYTEEELSKLAFAMPFEFKPGSRWNYSNTGYVLLGIIAHKAGGKFYGDQLKERVFQPLGMKTARIITEQDIVINRAAGYVFSAGGLKNQEWVSPVINTTADGSLYLSLDDMIAWDRGLRAGALLKADSWKLINDPVQLNSGNRFPYGMGWSIDTVAGMPRIHHGGAWQGFKAYIDRYMSDDLTVIVLANLANADPGVFATRVAAAVNPALAPKAMTSAIADRDPAQTDKFMQVIQTAATTGLSPADFAYVRAGFFPGAAKAYGDRLKSAGTLKEVILLDRKTVGDDRISTYEVRFEKVTLLSTLGVAPDGKISTFSLRPKP